MAATMMAADPDGVPDRSWVSITSPDLGTLEELTPPEDALWWREIQDEED